MKLLCIISETDTFISAIIETDKNYELVYSNDQGVKVIQRLRKDEYIDTEYFAMIYGKFEPYALFSKKPVRIKDRTFATLQNASGKLFDGNKPWMKGG